MQEARDVALVGLAAVRGGTADLGTLAEHVRWSVGGFTGVRAITVDARCWHDAGAAETDVVALAVSTGVAYVRRLVEEGIDVADAFYDRREKGFVNGLLDGVAKTVRGGSPAATETPEA